MRNRGPGGGRGGPALIAALILAASGAAGPARAAALDIGFGVEASTGAYASDEETRLVLLPVKFIFGGQRSRLTIAIQGVRIEGSGHVVPTADGPIVLGAGGPGRPAWQTGDAGSTASGFGDIVITQETFLVRAGRGKRPLLALVLDYKEPTANETKGLGTGEADWGSGLSYVQPLGKVVQLLAGATYRVMGDPEGIDFENRVNASLGLSFVSTRYLWRILAESQPPVLDEVPLHDAAGAVVGLVGVPDRRVARADLTLRSPYGGTTRIGLTKGFTDSAEDWGFVLQFSSGGQ